MPCDLASASASQVRSARDSSLNSCLTVPRIILEASLLSSSLHRSAWGVFRFGVNGFLTAIGCPEVWLNKRGGSKARPVVYILTEHVGMSTIFPGNAILHRRLKRTKIKL